LGVSRVVLLAGRTLQSLARLHFDLAPLLAVDHRIRLRYALHGDSDRRPHAERHALKLGIPLTPWKIAIGDHPDLVVSASADPELYEADAPLALIPHGATYNRVLDGLSGAAGTAREQVLGPGGQVPALMAMPGRAAVGQLATDCPEALASARVTGDLCMERMRTSTLMRRVYREALGVGPHQRLVVVSSTWGPYSLTAADRSLPEHLLSRLPADEFRVAYVPHPNIDADHGGMLLAYLRPALRNGLIMVPPEEGWRAVLVAADCVVGDSGSVTFYAANLGVPVLLAAFAFEEMAAGSPQEAFGRETAWLRREDDPAAQLRAAMRRGPVRSASLDAAWTEESPGPAALILARLYELLDLPGERVEPELLAPPLPIRDSGPLRAWHCDLALERGAGPTRVVGVRMPASRPVAEGLSEGAHLVAAQSCLVRALRADAEVLVFHDAVVSMEEVGALASSVFADHRGCALVSARVGADEGVVVFRDGRRFRFGCGGALFDVVPSAVLLVGAAGPVALRLGEAEALVEVVEV
ncbi:hypothetical protein AB0B28_20070, partial [Glycomyces sp. NPDC046736]|uniref:hypothetical protein n=1 Tax=Glycomyces sp. NPDC046736 TaxID=3155615 RepID=UPI0033DAB20F